MKTKGVSKYVYRKMLNGKFTRVGCSRTLDEDFPKLARMFEEFWVHHVEYDTLTADGILLPSKAWLDKHGNVIVRIFHDDTQIKINF